MEGSTALNIDFVTYKYQKKKSWRARYIFKCLKTEGGGGCCNKTFNCFSKLEAHFITHTKEQLHVCTFDGCNKSFGLVGNLRKHMDGHIGKNIKHCEICKKNYSIRYFYGKHRPQKHPELERTDSEEDP
jgi:hypothetical protein